MQNDTAMAKAVGFTNAALLPVRELAVVPESCKFCKQNLCGKYGVLPACPPMSGTVGEMTAGGSFLFSDSVLTCTGGFRKEAARAFFP